MPRTICITVPPDQTDIIVSEIRQAPGLIGLRVQRSTSLHPPGDVISLDVTARKLHALMRLLAAAS